MKGAKTQITSILDELEDIESTCFLVSRECEGAAHVALANVGERLGALSGQLGDIAAEIKNG